MSALSLTADRCVSFTIFPRLRNASKEISAQGPAQVHELVLELSDYESVRKAAAEVKRLGTPIKYLINNAAIMAVPYQKVNGYESHFVSYVHSAPLIASSLTRLCRNHLGHFLFTNLILDCFTDGGRIINVSSDGHGLSNVRFDDVNFKDGEEYDKWQGYGQSKSANILFSISLTKKLTTRNIESFSVHPGV